MRFTPLRPKALEPLNHGSPGGISSSRGPFWGSMLDFLPCSFFSDDFSPETKRHDERHKDQCLRRDQRFVNERN